MWRDVCVCVGGLVFADPGKGKPERVVGRMGGSEGTVLGGLFHVRLNSGSLTRGGAVLWGSLAR